MTKKLHVKSICGALFILLSVTALPGTKSAEKSYSLQAAQSFIKLNPDSIIYKDEAKSRRWNYEQGLMIEALFRVFQKTHDVAIYDYAKRNLDYYIESSGNIKTYSQDEYNLDNITPGRAALRFYTLDGEEKYKRAAEKLREQLAKHPRTKEGGFWHKKIYPSQMWLDGLYMAEPFYASYAEMFNDTAAMNDVINQFRLIARHAKDTKTGLLYHGWDESKTQKWANPETGTSPNFWSRSIGWYMMAITDVLEIIPDRNPGKKELVKILQDLSQSLLQVRDVKTKLWFQVLDKSAEKGNYIETSGSLMYIYAFAKGYNEGYLSRDYLKAAQESFASLQKNFIFQKPAGVLNLKNTVKVSGLGGNPYRDGSVAYYLSEPTRVNDMKGYGSLILAALELESASTAKGKVVALDNYFNNEWKNGVRYHYVWDDTAFSGFSEWGKCMQRMGAGLKTIYTAPTKKALDSSSVYIIVDPDTPAETKDPNYIDAKSIGIIKDWVSRGGVLCVLANDSTNCEFKHLNELMTAFGMKFDENSVHKVQGNNFEQGASKNFSRHPIFDGVKKIYLKEISTISATVKVDSILVENGKLIMAGEQFGKGYVYALGDPWLYNEYWDTRKLTAGFENNKAGKNLIEWLLAKSKVVIK
jgi:unsaturated rhamnogalacturonyl hydrolase